MVCILDSTEKMPSPYVHVTKGTDFFQHNFVKISYHIYTSYLVLVPNRDYPTV